MLPERGPTGSNGRRTCDGPIETDEFSLSDGFSSTERERKESEICFVLVDGPASTVGRTVARLIALIRPGRDAGGLVLGMRGL
jgi:hypothetical protein